MPYLELDDIIYNIQRFGGASTYWTELTSRLSEFIPAAIVRSTSSKFMRLYSPRSSAKVFHSSHFRVSSSPFVKNITTIHDLIYEKGLAKGRARKINLYERKKAIKKADAIICISESTRGDLEEFYGELIGSKPIHVIYHGCSKLPIVLDDKIFSTTLSRYLDLNLSAGNFFIFVGGRAGYKNFKLVLDAFVLGKFSRLGFRIICTGSYFNDYERNMISNLGLTDLVVSIGFVDRATLGALYGVSRALVYPSAYEGFGLPPLEAMASGCPVICSRSSSLPEVVGVSGILIEPSSVDELAAAMSSVLQTEVREHFIELGIEHVKQFDWRETARAHATLYESLASF